MKRDLLQKIFNPHKEKEFVYLGYSYIPYHPIEDKKYYDIIRGMQIEIDRKLRPFWIPKWVMRWLYYLGHKTVFHVKRRWASNLLRKILKYNWITDIKTKWDITDIRIYGMFTDEIEKIVDDAVEKIERINES